MHQNFIKTVINKKVSFYSYLFFIVALFSFSQSAQAAVLLPGNISTCGELAAPGTYTLTQSVSGGSDTCFTIGSDNVVINGGGFIVSGTGSVAIDARARTSGAGSALTEGSHAYTNLIVNDINISGYTTGINISGNADTTGSGINNGYGGDAGDMAIYYSSVLDIIADGGSSSSKTYGGLGGNISFTDTDLDISDSSISALGGVGTSGRNGHGGLDLNYTGDLTRSNVSFSQLAFLNDNDTEYTSYIGGTWPIVPGTISSCGTLFGSGTYVLSQNVTSTSTCFLVGSNDVIINGAGYSITSNDDATTEFAINAGTFTGFTLASTTVIDFSNLIIASSSVTISGHNVDVSDMYVSVGGLTLTHTGTLDHDGFSYSALSTLIINGTSYGAVSAGASPTAVGSVWSEQTGAGSRNWYSIASSYDGTKLIAGAYGGYLYTSADSGTTWTERTVVSSRNWRSVVSSSDGTKLAAAVYSGYIYTSTDSGVTWTTRTGSGLLNWYDITSSSDGTKLAAVVNNGYIYTSTDGGVTWTQRTSSGSRTWQSITSSADGTKLAATYGTGYIYTSTDSGVTWTQQTGSGSRNWYDVTSSADGTKLVAAHYGGYIYTSIDSGVTWTAQTDPGSRTWRYITSSTDGTKLAAVYGSGYIYTSTDSGVTWTQRTGAGSRNWYSIASSADGSKLIAGVSSGYLYVTKLPFPEFDISIIKPMSSENITEWSPYVSWSIADNCYYSFDNWTSTSTANCSLEGSDITSPGKGSHTLYIRGSNALGTVVQENTSFSFNPPITITSPVSEEVLTVWSPVIDWDPNDTADVVTCLYSYDSFVSTSTATCASNGSDILPPSDSSTTTLSLVVIDEDGGVGTNSVTFRLNLPITITSPTTSQVVTSWSPVIDWDPNDTADVVTCLYSYDSFVSTSTATCASNGSDILPPAALGTTTMSLKVIDSQGILGLSSVTFNYSVTGSWDARDSDRNWYAVTSSSDGVKLGAVHYGGYIYTSTDSGATWTARTGAGSRNWDSIASSDDGVKLVASANSASYIFTSTDSGANWTQRTGAGARNWQSVTSSSDGVKLAAVNTSGYVYTSTDSGANWTERTGSGSRAWLSITSSADGTKLAAAVNNGYIYTSTDSGVTWTVRTGAGSRSWYSVSSSSDGTKLVAAGLSSYVWTSTDGGVNWTQQTGSGSRNWYSVKSSSDGTRLSAVHYGGYIYTSTDSGVTWISQINASSRNWRSVTSSSDGLKLTAAVYGGKIYTTAISTSTFSLLRPINNTSILSTAWSALVNWGSSVSCYYSYNNFVSTSTVSCANNGSDIDMPAMGGLYTLYVRGLDALGNYYNQNSSFEFETLIQRGSTGNWYSIASSEDGVKLAAVAYSGYIYTSTNSGTTWTQQTASGSRNWKSIASSADGTKLAAAAYSGYIYTSTDSGVTWTQQSNSGSRTWNSITSSSDGLKLAAANYTGGVYTSTNGGVNWTLQVGSGAKDWFSIASSADGTKLVGTDYTRYIWTSIDSGVNWVQRTGSGLNTWYSVASSADGVKLAAVTYSGYIYTSTDSGANWTQQTASGSRSWRSITSSADGTKLAATAYGGYIYVSADSGVTWTSRMTDSVRNWFPITSSADGNKIVAGITNGYLYNSTSNPSITTPTASSTVVSWAPSISWNRAMTCEYSYDNTNWNTVSCSGTGSDISAPSTSGAKTLYIRSTDFRDYVTTTSVYFTYLAGLTNTISSCGNISSAGTYTLTTDITDVVGTCFTVNANNVTINGGGHSVTGAVGNTSYGITTNYSNLVLEDITISGFGTGSVSSSNSVTYSGTDVDISNSTSTVSSSLTISYTNTLTATQSYISSVSNLIINSINLQTVVAGVFSWIQQDVSACGNISAPGYYTLTQDISNVSGTCFNITSRLVIFDGAGHTISAAGGNTDYAFVATAANTHSYSNIGIKDLILSGFAGGVDARGADGVTGNVLGKNGGKISLYDVTFPADKIAVNTSGGDGFYENNTTAQGGNGASVKIVDSTVGEVIVSAGDTNGDLNIGASNGTMAGGIIGGVTSTNSTIATTTANGGLAYIPGCIDDSYDNYNSIATYDDGSCLDGWLTGTDSNYWYSMASSADGTKLVGVVNNTQIYTSTDSGATWTQQSNSEAQNWYSVASSADGTKLAAVVYGGYIYTSTNSGVTWTQQSNSGYQNWYSIASSADGTKLAAVVYGGYIYTSTDSGATWTEQGIAGARGWSSIASSADGTKLAATENGGYIYTSTDSGITWTQQSSSGYQSWLAIASSADGTKLAAVVYGGYIYTSTDSGSNWTEQTGAGNQNWQSIASSADGTKLAAGVYDGYVYTSVDSGVIWTQQPDPGYQYWKTILLSADGNKIIAVENGGYVYRYSFPNPDIKIDILSPLTSSTQTSWNPIVSWGTSVLCEYSYDNSNWTTVSCSSLGSDIPSPSYGSNTLYVKGTDISSAQVTVSSSFSLNIPLTIISPTTGSLASWNPSVTWNSANLSDISCYYSYFGFSNDYAVNCANAGSDIIAPASNGEATLYLTVHDNVSGANGYASVMFTVGWVAVGDILNWSSVASSADGTKLAAVAYGGYIQTSTDSGVTWTLQANSGWQNWKSITSSADGTKLAAVVSGGYIYTSTDSGSNWTERTGSGSRSWQSIASSADGTKLAAVAYGGYIYTSTDSGATWTQQSDPGTNNWKSITSSADGTKLAAVVDGGYVWTSTDGGVTWIQQYNSPSQGWYSIVSSTDGTKLAAVAYNGYIYTSTDSGVNWSQQTNPGSHSWYSITSSSDGTKLAAVVEGGYIYISTDSGSNWTVQTGAGSLYWTSVTSSADGNKFVAVTSNDNIYRYSSFNPSLKVDILSPLPSSSSGFWNPIVSWGTSVLCEYSYDNSNWTTVSCSSLGSDIAEPSYGSNTLYVRGTDIASTQITSSVTFDYIHYTWCGTSNNDWNDASNWYTSSSCSIPAPSIPDSTIGVALVGSVSPLVNLGDWIAPSSIDSTGLTGAATSVGVEFTAPSTTCSPNITITGNATFKEYSCNGSTVTGDAIFDDVSFNNSTVEGDMFLNSTYYSGSAATSSILIVSNVPWSSIVEGTIFASDGITAITSFAFIGSGSNTVHITSNVTFSGTSANNSTITGDVVFSGASSNTGTITGNVTFNNTSPFRIGTVNGTVTLSGLAQTIQGVNNITNLTKASGVRDVLYLTSGATLNISGLLTLTGANSSNLLTIRSTTPGTYATLNINSTNDIGYVRMKDIRNTASLVDLSSETAFDDGGNTGFTFPANTTPGERNAVTYSYTPPSIPASRLPAPAPTPSESQPVVVSGLPVSGATLDRFINPSIRPITFKPIETFDLFGNNNNTNNVGATILPNPLQDLQAPTFIDFIKLPTRFLNNLSKFILNATLKNDNRKYSNTLISYLDLNSIDINKEQDLARLSIKSLKITGSENNPYSDLFAIKVNDNNVNSLLSYDNKINSLVQTVKVPANKNIVLVSESAKSIKYFNKTFNFSKNINVLTPEKSGRYMVESSNIPLVLDVIGEVVSDQEKQGGLMNWLRKLFR